ncbi:FAD-dependent oxidoreductase [Marinomonas balearica]|uniref:2-polyprenyl-6-methoxyphenol hydroxylase-like FAD-dependent oxidoreductase n=1 Tax=Marinomonas balearica TaxID=491947 RepID=A0A4R6M9D4_9GAMM|nr:NAD(P)/FAD-dependent oxidoreductase [Marinomonas balearica]TDO98014.1 2-polyprenyl-6-methoxyphenol hydroxylase-like FAD-dependent oxidoreductase [Marinomonas balearica]
MNSMKKIIIIGAGISGMAFAILAKRKGFQVSMYERASCISSIGAGVTLWPNAMFVLDKMGLSKTIECAGGAPKFTRQYDKDGIQQSELDIEAINRLSNAPCVTIFRRDLLAILAEALEKIEVKIHFNHAITEQDIDRLKQDADLVVGCDGRMNSPVRKYLYTDKVLPKYQGFINIVGISQLKTDTLDHAIQDYRFNDHETKQERFGIVPVKNNQCFWAAAWRTEMDKERPLSDWYREMHQRFQLWPENIRNVLSSYDKPSLNRIFVHDLDPLPYWHKDNVVMIGDAAHAALPTSGQGACQALEDAWHLAQTLETECVQKREIDLDSKLNTFFQKRIAKTTSTQTIGRQLARQIFDMNTEPTLNHKAISVNQLTQLWMQGLEV